MSSSGYPKQRLIYVGVYARLMDFIVPNAGNLFPPSVVVNTAMKTFGGAQ